MRSISRISCQKVPRFLKSPFRTSLRTVSHFDVIQFHVETNDGLRAIGEAVETPAITGDTQESIVSGLLDQISVAIEGISFSSPLELADRISDTKANASAKAAADMALYFLKAEMEDRTLNEILGGTRTSVASDVTIPVAELEEIESIVVSRLQGGFKTFKVKFAMEPIKTSVQKLRLINDFAYGRCALRIDPNQAWTVAHTLQFLEELGKTEIVVDYLEQPNNAKDKKGLAEIRSNSQTPIMADESCFDMGDLLELVELEAVDLVNLKLLKTGGITPILKMAEVAQQSGVGVRLGSMMEGDAGVMAAACLASVLAPGGIHDLDASWWAKDSKVLYRSGEVVLR